MTRIFPKIFRAAIFRPAFLLLAISLIFWSPSPVIMAATATALEPGSLFGTVKVFRTKVKTQGDKSGKEVLIYLETEDKPPGPPSSCIVTMDQKGLVFIPHVLPVQVGTTVEFLNNDTVDHNVYFLSEITGKTLDLGTWPQGVSVKHTFTEKDTVIVLCKLHLEMAAYVVAVDTPYFTTAVLDESSQEAVFRIGGLPPGRYTIKTWHKKLLLQDGPREIQIKGGHEVRADLVITKRKYAR